MSDTGPWPLDMVERLKVRKVEDLGAPFVHLRDANKDLVVVGLPVELGTVVIGRNPSAEIVVGWDERVSRVHARLTVVGGGWTVEDDGLSRNGTFVNGQRVPGTRRLQDRDVIQVGRTTIVFRCAATELGQTLAASRPGTGLELSPMQARVLSALCRPVVEGGETPATNEDIAAEVYLSVDAVKAHLRQLFRKFGIEGLPQNQKRARLVRLAIDAGLAAG